VPRLILPHISSRRRALKDSHVRQGVHRQALPMKTEYSWSAMLASVALLMSNAACAAEVRVMISAGFFDVYSELGAEFERATGHRLVTTRGPSTGDSPEAIPARLARGEPADVIILEGGSTDELGRKGVVRTDSKVVLALAQTGLVVRAGAPEPDIGSVELFRKALLSAKSIAYSDSGSGRFIVDTMLPKLGIADQVMPKARRVRGPPSGEPVAAVVARGDAEIGLQDVSELIHVPGIAYVGPIPAELDRHSTYAAVITTRANEPEAAKALIRLLSSPQAEPIILKAGLTLPVRNPTP
jgi:ABC-type molybdate transport system, periplasmic component